MSYALAVLFVSSLSTFKAQARQGHEENELSNFQVVKLAGFME